MSSGYVDSRSQRGVTLLELLLAVMLLTMVSAMLYSVLNVSMKFAARGEDKILQIAREGSLLELIHQQVHGAAYSAKTRQVLLTADDEYLKVVTNHALIFRDWGRVLAIYRYEPGEDILYYTEKLDFYNQDYGEDYLPDFDDMVVLLRNVGGLAMEYDEEEAVLTVNYNGGTYEIIPRCR